MLEDPNIFGLAEGHNVSLSDHEFYNSLTDYQLTVNWNPDKHASKQLPLVLSIFAMVILFSAFVAFLAFYFSYLQEICSRSRLKGKKI